MSRGLITDAIKTGRILVSDGAWGTCLQKIGLTPGECPELWCIERPDDVLAIAQSYIDVGSDIIETNSFGASSYKLAHYGLANRVSEINKAAVAISRKAAGDDKWVIAAMGPTGKILLTGDVTRQALLDCFSEQAIALEAGGADAIFLETMIDIDEAVLAIQAAKQNTKCQIVCSFTFQRTIQGQYRTMMGASPAETVKASLAAGADIIGTNCGNGIKPMIEIVRQMRAAAPNAPILVHANAGIPTNVDGVDIFPETPEEMAGLIPEMIDAGANIIGGCCGTTPAHITAIKNAVEAATK